VNENPSRAELLAQLRRIGREHGDATVLFHSALATQLGLHPTDYKALGVLDRLGPMSAGDLGRHTGLAAASVTNLIDRLVAKGFLRREPDPTDRRARSCTPRSITSPTTSSPRRGNAQRHGCGSVTPTRNWPSSSTS
jgi:hypothetical protein